MAGLFVPRRTSRIFIDGKDNAEKLYFNSNEIWRKPLPSTFQRKVVQDNENILFIGSSDLACLLGHTWRVPTPHHRHNWFNTFRSNYSGSFQGRTTATDVVLNGVAAALELGRVGIESLVQDFLNKDIPERMNPFVSADFYDAVVLDTSDYDIGDYRAPWTIEHDSDYRNLTSIPTGYHWGRFEMQNLINRDIESKMRIIRHLISKGTNNIYICAPWPRLLNGGNFDNAQHRDQLDLEWYNTRFQNLEDGMFYLQDRLNFQIKKELLGGHVSIIPFHDVFRRIFSDISSNVTPLFLDNIRRLYANQDNLDDSDPLSLEYSKHQYMLNYVGGYALNTLFAEQVLDVDSSQIGNIDGFGNTIDQDTASYFSNVAKDIVEYHSRTGTGGEHTGFIMRTIKDLEPEDILGDKLLLRLTEHDVVEDQTLMFDKPGRVATVIAIFDIDMDVFLETNNQDYYKSMIEFRDSYGKTMGIQSTKSEETNDIIWLGLGYGDWNSYSVMRAVDVEGSGNKILFMCETTTPDNDETRFGDNQYMIVKNIMKEFNYDRYFESGSSTTPLGTNSNDSNQVRFLRQDFGLVEFIVVNERLTDGEIFNLFRFFSKEYQYPHVWEKLHPDLDENYIPIDDTMEPYEDAGGTDPDPDPDPGPDPEPGVDIILPSDFEDTTYSLPPNESSYIHTNPPMGINIGGITDWSSQFPLLNEFKQSRPWIAERNPNASDIHFEDLIDQGYINQHGIPISIPAGYPRLLSYQHADIPSYFEESSAEYEITWEGDVDLGVDFSVTDVVYSDHKIEFRKTGGTMGIYVDRIGSGDPLSNVVMVKKKNKDLLDSGHLFNPVWMNELKNFRNIRFMDWGRTNDSIIETFSDRPLVDDIFWSVKGAPVEIMVELCKQLGTDGWFCIPHLADEDYIKGVSRIIRDSMPSKNMAFYEYSNEVWNWMFSQARYMNQMVRDDWGIEPSGAMWMEYAGMKAAIMADYIDEVYQETNQTNYKKVLGLISTGQDDVNTALGMSPTWLSREPGQTEPYQRFDYGASTGYFGGFFYDDTNGPVMETWLEDSIQEAEDTADNDGLIGQERIDYIEEHKYDLIDSKAKEAIIWGSEEIQTFGTDLTGLSTVWKLNGDRCDTFGMKHIMYEGGTHMLVPESLREGQPGYNEELHYWMEHFNYSDNIEEIYRYLFRIWHEYGYEIFNQFVDTGIPNKYGYWGAMKYYGDITEPKWVNIKSINYSFESHETGRDPDAFIGIFESYLESWELLGSTGEITINNMEVPEENIISKDNNSIIINT